MSWSPTQIQMSLRAIGTAQRGGAARGLHLATEHVLGVARTRVPIEEGTLERSGTASVDEDTLTGAVSFDTPYAVRQHEDMDLKHDAGRQAKYLESALASERQTCRDLIARSIRNGLEG